MDTLTQTVVLPSQENDFFNKASLRNFFPTIEEQNASAPPVQMHINMPERSGSSLQYGHEVGHISVAPYLYQTGVDLMPDQLIIHGLSLHYGGGEDADYIDTDGELKRYNEVNTGIGLGWEISDRTDLTINVFENSYGDTGKAIIVEHDLIQSEKIGLGIFAGAVHGYEKRLDPEDRQYLHAGWMPIAGVQGHYDITDNAEISMRFNPAIGVEQEILNEQTGETLDVGGTQALVSASVVYKF